jgi:hypothetical protein
MEIQFSEYKGNCGAENEFLQDWVEVIIPIPQEGNDNRWESYQEYT